MDFEPGELFVVLEVQIFMPVRKCGKALHVLSATPDYNSTCAGITIELCHWRDGTS